MNTLGEKIRNLREEKGLPLRIVAASLDLDQAVLSKIERGQRIASREQVVKLARLFETDENDLLVQWLSDKLVNDVEGEEMALKALQVAEEKVLYRQSVENDTEKLTIELRKILSGFEAVKKAWVFGSYSRGNLKTSSDIDVLIDVPPELAFTLFDIAEIKDQIQKALCRDADVVMLSAIRPQVKQRIYNDMKLIYEA